MRKIFLLIGLSLITLVFLCYKQANAELPINNQPTTNDDFKLNPTALIIPPLPPLICCNRDLNRDTSSSESFVSTVEIDINGRPATMIKRMETEEDCGRASGDWPPGQVIANSECGTWCLNIPNLARCNLCCNMIYPTQNPTDRSVCRGGCLVLDLIRQSHEVVQCTDSIDEAMSCNCSGVTCPDGVRCTCSSSQNSSDEIGECHLNTCYLPLDNSDSTNLPNTETTATESIQTNETIIANETGSITPGTIPGIIEDKSQLSEISVIHPSNIGQVCCETPINLDNFDTSMTSGSQRNLLTEEECNRNGGLIVKLDLCTGVVSNTNQPELTTINLSTTTYDTTSRTSNNTSPTNTLTCTCSGSVPQENLLVGEKRCIESNNRSDYWECISNVNGPGCIRRVADCPDDKVCEDLSDSDPPQVQCIPKPLN